ncbi:MAG: polysaccharide export protein, partial [Alphaproteobacteria bacterium]|nr:polysaccharide export protein [Alphaproteobacteria bacterium]
MNALFALNSFAEDIYKLGSGDQMRITIYGEKDLSGEYEVDGTGSVALPLIGEVNVDGLSLREAEKAITEAYKGDYLLNPRVNAEVMNFRPFFILGEVNEPGNYPYISGMNVLNAVAVAKGYTYRANKNRIVRRRLVDGKEVEEEVKELDKVFPGDVLHV